MKTRLQLEALPPTVNHIYRHTKNGTFRTQEYNTWSNAMGWSIKAQMRGQPKWNDPVYVTIAMRRPRSNCDLDNRLKAAADLLQAHGVIANDKLIHGWNAFWSTSLPAGVAAEISITAADPFGLEAA